MIAQLAARQWGVVARAQLLALGIGRGAIDARVLGGRLHPLHAGVYAVGHRALERRGRELAAVLACGAGAVLSHRSAARHWGLLVVDLGVVDVSAARSVRGATGIRLHRPRELLERDRWVHDRMPITSVARTMLDLAEVAPASLDRALAQAERLQRYDLRQLRDVLDRAGGHRGARRLERAIAAEPAFTRSELETRFLAIVRRAELAPPHVNHVLDVPDHGPAEVDFFWPRSGLIAETDGWDAHRTRAAFAADRRRDAALVAAGYRVLRFTWWDVVTDAATVLRRLRTDRGLHRP